MSAAPEQGLHEEMIEKMAQAMWTAENVRVMGKPRLCDWAEAGDYQHMRWRDVARAAAEAIGLREMAEALTRVAEGRVDWAHKPADEMRDIAAAALNFPRVPK